MAPHFGIMNEDELGEKNAAFTRTRLHIRSAKRRLSEGKISHGIATYWDAVTYGLRWYYFTHMYEISEHEKEDIYYPEKLFPLLVKSAILKTNFDFDKWNEVAENAIDGPFTDYDPSELMVDFEMLFTDLGIWPFDETELPDEFTDIY